jgi:methylmalonyl-CoA mutase C-terminal domain/subunit
MEGACSTLMAKPGFDGHWRGAMVVSTALRDAGMEVIFVGNQSPKEIVEVALQEDVDVIGLSILAASYKRLIQEVLHILQEKEVKNVVMLVGGTIIQEDIPYLKEIGVDQVFPPGSKLEPIVECVEREVRLRRSQLY